LPNNNLSKHPLHQRYHTLKNYHTNPNNQGYKYYGGRGFTWPNEWASFEEFLFSVERRIGALPGPGYCLDRIDNDADYSPTNIRWSTMQEDANNRRTNHLITYRRRTQTIAEWAIERDISARTLYSRLFDLGWAVGEALNFKNHIRTYKHAK
jgi:hypothetical protein